MTVRAKMLRMLAQEDINFLLTNRIPRRLATKFIGWFSRIEHPLVRDGSIAIWRLFSDLDLAEARKTQFEESARLLYPRAESRAPGRSITGRSFWSARATRSWEHAAKSPARQLYQAKGFPYALGDLLSDADLVEVYRGGCYVTLRLTAAMYHRFHAPHDCRVTRVIYISGDTWNVNPIALKRVERLFCKNERAVDRGTPHRDRRARHTGRGRGHFGRRDSSALSRRLRRPPAPRRKRLHLRRACP